VVIGAFALTIASLAAAPVDDGSWKQPAAAIPRSKVHEVHADGERVHDATETPPHQP